MKASYNGVEMPIEVVEYLFTNFAKIKEINGDVKRVTRYGGSAFVQFQNNRTYRVSISLYNDKVNADENLK